MPTGKLRGRHYSTHAAEVRALKRKGRLEEAERLLWEIVEVVEREARAKHSAPAPWYYEQLAILARKRKDYAAEVAVLERYATWGHFDERLAKARKLASGRPSRQ